MRSLALAAWFLLLMVSGPQLVFAAPQAAELNWELPVLCYHRFGPESKGDLYQISASRFESQLKWLEAEGYRSVSLTQTAQALAGLEPAGWPAKPVMLTIDDGYKNAWIIAGPLLKKYGFSAVYFLTSDMIGTGKRWLNFKDLKQMRRQGLELGSHSRSHANLAKPKKNESPLEFKTRVMDELLDSKVKIEKGLGEKITALAYPYGAYNRVIENWVQAAGYSMAFSVSKGRNRLGTQKYRIRRNILMGHPLKKSFRKLVQGRSLRAADIAEAQVWVQGFIPKKLELGFLETASIQIRVGKRKINIQKSSAKNVNHIALPEDLKNGFHLLKFTAEKDGSRYESHSLFQLIRPQWAPHFVKNTTP